MVDDSSEDKVEAICNGLCSYILYTSVQCTLQDADIIATGDLELPYKEGAEWSKTKVVIQFPFQPHPRNTLFVLQCRKSQVKLRPQKNKRISVYARQRLSRAFSSAVTQRINRWWSKERVTFSTGAVSST